MTDEIARLARSFADAMNGRAGSDWAEAFASRVTVWQIDQAEPEEFDGRVVAEMSAEESENYTQLMPDYHTEGQRTFVSHDGFVFCHTALGTLGDGTNVVYPFCVVATVQEGLITRLDLFQDRQQAAPLAQAIQSRMAEKEAAATR
jgi:ketosteroid isomerase-like protein